MYAGSVLHQQCSGALTNDRRDFGGQETESAKMSVFNKSFHEIFNGVSQSLVLGDFVEGDEAEGLVDFEVLLLELHEVENRYYREYY